MLEVQNLSVSYREIIALSNISFSLSSGSLVGLIGANGAGKSTLLKAMLELIPAQSGQIFFDGQPLKKQRHKVAYLPQRSQIDWDYPVTVWNVVMMARTQHSGWFGKVSRQSKEIVRQALERVELYELRDRPIKNLSGGQQQRVFLARALAQQAEILLLDEPLTAVDKKTEALMWQIYSELKQEGKTLLISCHEWGSPLDRYDQLLLLNRQLVASGTPRQVLTNKNIQLAYGAPFAPTNQDSFDHTDELLFC
ncbi:ABC transporter ATP-binding protein [Pseudanabaena sp. FACHB-1998]|uniref:metal ABC transporter ATP-binding protein n=1 Tax=Pseudanabaena sp. FACHB-1998 TaxID=2692858 RepID=UPI0016804FB1|nr:ABC transporter ATP-binding protein [Pseudanabaena sp. FACHB-1998]MBD2178489.1 ABC transporter ATP-binding protein [Pseudanabaena sp. FACHB-1998]